MHARLQPVNEIPATTTCDDNVLFPMHIPSHYHIVKAAQLMRYEITLPKITFFLDNPKREASSQVNLSCASELVTEADLVRICAAITRQFHGQAAGTQRNSLGKFLKPMLSFIEFSGAAFPKNSDDWQLFLLCFFQFFLSNASWSTASAISRIGYWKTLVTAILQFWAVDEILPLDVSIPSIRSKNVRSETKIQRLVGERKPSPVPIAAPPQKILVSIEFGNHAADYLDRIERACKDKIGVIKDVCLLHWNALISDVETGRLFSESVSESDIVAVVETGEYRQRVKGGSSSPLGSPAHPRGHLWALSVTKRFIIGGEDQQCVSIETHRTSPFFKSEVFADGCFYDALTLHTAMPTDAFMQLTPIEQYYRFAGLLSSLDAAAACCLLTIEHPQFTSDALQSARLLSSRGKSYLLLTDNDDSSILSLDKPRAKSRKSVALTPVSQKIISELIALTAPVRNVLRRAGDKTWRYLFLGYGKSGRLGVLIPRSRYLNDADLARSLVRLYPQLSEHNLVKGTFDYRRIRATMGVLRWFETGSIIEMSRRLGNTKRVALEHYLPAALLHAWNTRIIRRFQNTLIILAAHDEDYLLEVTDFSSISDLQNFIAQLVLEYPGTSSPLAKEVRERLGQTFFADNSNSNFAVEEGLLNIRLSATSLTYLYAFSDFAVRTLSADDLVQVDSHSNLAPIQFIDLTRLIRHACESELVAADLSELLDLPRLRRMHEQAKIKQTALAGQFSKMSIAKKWEKLDV